MGKRDARIDAYIENAREFAQPILREIRERVHGVCPEVEETLKWNVFRANLQKAMALNEQGITVSRGARPRKPVLAVPDHLAAALDENTRARAAFDAFSPSHRREYIEWITEAKTEATRTKRIAQAIQLMADGKSRHWKYAGPRPAKG